MEVYGNTRGSGDGPGKGDKRRPTDDKKFRSNFDEIDWAPLAKRMGAPVICCCPNPKPCGCSDGTCLNCGWKNR